MGCGRSSLPKMQRGNAKAQSWKYTPSFMWIFQTGLRSRDTLETLFDNRHARTLSWRLTENGKEVLSRLLIFDRFEILLNLLGSCIIVWLVKAGKIGCACGFVGRYFAERSNDEGSDKLFEISPAITVLEDSQLLLNRASMHQRGPNGIELCKELLCLLCPLLG